MRLTSPRKTKYGSTARTAPTMTASDGYTESRDKRLNDKAESKWGVYAAGDVRPDAHERIKQIVQHRFRPIATSTRR